MNNDFVIIKDNMNKIKDIFSTVSVKCMETFFQQKCNIKKPWEIVNHLSCNFDYVFTIGSSNEKYKSILAHGIQKSSLETLVGKSEIPYDEILDVFGEFTNTYCGMIADENDFTEMFGVLRQSLPVLYTNGQTILSFLWGVSGKIYFGDEWMYFGYAIHQQNYESK